MDASAYPDGAIWPAELQDPAVFSQQGQIQNWDAWPEYLDGDFFDLKDIQLGPDSVDYFQAPSALNTLVEIYKYWIAYADIDGFRIDTVKHMGDGPTRYFASAIHEFAARIGKERFLLVGEITGQRAYEVVEATGLDAALGIGNMQQLLWRLPRGEINPVEYFDMFRNATYLKKGSHSWLRDKVVTMIDDHDQVWRGEHKKRFCGANPGPKMVFAALAMNLCTLGIPCVYYGSEQRFDGEGRSDGKGHNADQYIRESMFGGGFGPFRSRDRHCFDESTEVYRNVAAVAKIRANEIILKRGRQYLREISGDGVGFGYPTVIGDRMKSLVAWSRIFDGVEILCAINTDEDKETTAWVTVDGAIQSEGRELKALYPVGKDSLKVGVVGGRAVVKLTVAPAGFVLFR